MTAEHIASREYRTDARILSHTITQNSGITSLFSSVSNSAHLRCCSSRKVDHHKSQGASNMMLQSGQPIAPKAFASGLTRGRHEPPANMLPFDSVNCTGPALDLLTNSGSGLTQGRTKLKLETSGGLAADARNSRFSTLQLLPYKSNRKSLVFPDHIGANGARAKRGVLHPDPPLGGGGRCILPQSPSSPSVGRQDERLVGRLDNG